MNEQPPQEISFLDLIRILIQHKWVMFVVFVLIQVGAAVYAYKATLTYKVGVIVAPSAETGSSGGLSSIMNAVGGGGALGAFARSREQVSQGMAILQSEQFVREFIQKNNLLPVLYASRWDSTTSDWKEPDSDDVPRISDGYRKFNSILNVSDEDSGLVQLDVVWSNPDLAAKWANDLVFTLNERLRSIAIKEANQTIDYLNKEVEKTRIVELRQAIYFMIEEQINIRTMANIQQEYAFKVISPAIAPELDQYSSPRYPLIFALALIFGVVLGAMACWVIYGIQRLREEILD